MTARRRAGLALLAGALAAGCGQTGALYLPDADIATPVEIRGPAQPPAAPPADADEDEVARDDPPEA